MSIDLLRGGAELCSESLHVVDGGLDRWVVGKCVDSREDRIHLRQESLHLRNHVACCRHEINHRNTFDCVSRLKYIRRIRTQTKIHHGRAKHLFCHIDSGASWNLEVRIDGDLYSEVLTARIELNGFNCTNFQSVGTHIRCCWHAHHGGNLYVVGNFIIKQFEPLEEYGAYIDDDG